MSVKNPITVNGVILSEYIKDHDKIISRIRGETLKKEGNDKVSLYQKPKIRYKNHHEKNGEIKIMGNYELSIENYENYLKKELLGTNSLSNLCVIILLCDSRHEKYTSRIIGNILIEYSKKLNIPVNKNLEFAVRARLGALKKSALADHMFIPKRKIGMPTYYSMSPQAKKSLTLEKALELAKTRKIKKDSGIQKIDRSEISKSESKQGNKNELPTNEKQSNYKTFSAINKIFEHIGKMNQDKNIFFIVCGDFTVNLHLPKE
jgi:hypothetical protein